MRGIAFATAFTLALSVVPAPAATTAPTAPPAPKEWSAKMHALAKTTNALLPELYTRTPDRKVLLKHAKTLSDLAHSLSGDASDKMKRPDGDSDATLPLLAGQFAEDAKSAYSAIRNHHLGYGVAMLRTLTSHCIACHTRNDSGVSYPQFPLTPSTKSLGRVELADLYVATRQFDKAFAEYLGVVSDDKFAKKNPLEWERAVRHGLSVAIRVKKSPDLALQIVDKVTAQPAAPEFLRRNAVRWKASLTKWKSEPAPAETATEAALFEETQRLLKAAQDAQEYPADASANVEYLRATSTAHDLLGRFPEGKHAPDALYAAGVAYDVIADPAQWPSHQLYFEACVRRAPHTDLALRCYDRYEQSIYIGYSGSAGSFIPEDMLTRMRDLKKLSATPETITPSP